ncbi:hypothetical protein GWK47_017941 [Chionoecetes opilio]|uniref:Uncharacterized protein n=1 Tax=Chionoecetes opilio TaxID=41210 RepID=A0A8J4XS82_CHIOP|nr:hypothetical protein GWK47_017941 [Chionoecetes opilio]
MRAAGALEILGKLYIPLVAPVQKEAGHVKKSSADWHSPPGFWTRQRESFLGRDKDLVFKSVHTLKSAPAAPTKLPHEDPGWPTPPPGSHTPRPRTPRPTQLPHTASQAPTPPPSATPPVPALHEHSQSMNTVIHEYSQSKQSAAYSSQHSQSIIPVRPYTHLHDHDTVTEDTQGEGAKGILAGCRGGSSAATVTRRASSASAARGWSNRAHGTAPRGTMKMMTKHDSNSTKPGIMIHIPQYPLYSIGYYWTSNQLGVGTMAELERGTPRPRKCVCPSGLGGDQPCLQTTTG